MRAGRTWALAAWLAAGASGATAQPEADAVVQQLREQGYVEFAVSRTLLGRVRVVALGPDGGRREIVFNAATGEILRDYYQATEGGGAPRILDRSEDDGEPGAAPSPLDGGGDGEAPRHTRDRNVGEDGSRGHGDDEDGFDDDNPGRGHGNGGNPGRSGGSNGNGPDSGQGNGNGG